MYSSLYRTVIRAHFFICWITLPAYLKSWDFQKRRKQKEFGDLLVRNVYYGQVQMLLKHCDMLE